MTRRLKIGLNAVSLVALAAGRSLAQQKRILDGGKAHGSGSPISCFFSFSGLDEERAEVPPQQQRSTCRRERR
jgi:hypothetical protein